MTFLMSTPQNSLDHQKQGRPVQMSQPKGALRRHDD